MQTDTIAAQKRRIVRCHNKIMTSPILCWLGSVVLVGDVTYTTPAEALGQEIPTAATDGYNITYNTDFMATLGEAEVMGVVVHENLHKAYRQLQLWEKLFKRPTPGMAGDALMDCQRHNALVNMAMDYVINTDIKAMEAAQPSLIRLPKHGLYDPAFANMNTKQVLDELKKNPPPESQTIDVHRPPIAGDAPSKEQQLVLEAALQEGKIIQKMRQAGTGQSAGDRALQSLRPPKLPWQELMRRWLTDRVAGDGLPTYSRLHRRTALCNYPVPSRFEEAMGDIVLADDTSGSTSDEEQQLMLSDIVGLTKSLRPTTTHLIYWGSSVVAHETYTRDTVDTLAKSTKPRHGGGTSVSCVHKWVTESKIKPAMLVIFTDGYIDDWPPSWPCPVFAVVTTDQHVPIPYASLR
jgi:predicted metal-dependent peptidase